jgi:hypothetical protein
VAWNSVLDDAGINVPFEQLLEHLLARPAEINPYDKENFRPFVSEI